MKVLRIGDINIAVYGDTDAENEEPHIKAYIQDVDLDEIRL